MWGYSVSYTRPQPPAAGAPDKAGQDDDGGHIGQHADEKRGTAVTPTRSNSFCSAWV